MRHKDTRCGVFIFVNRRRNAIKLIKRDHDGLAIYHMRLERGVFETPKRTSDGEGLSISGDQLSLILRCIRLSLVVQNKRFVLWV
jgi:hypothetical protein